MKLSKLKETDISKSYPLLMARCFITVVSLQNCFQKHYTCGDPSDYFQRLLPVVTFQIGCSSVFITSGDLCYSFSSKVTPMVTLQKSNQFSQLATWSEENDTKSKWCSLAGKIDLIFGGSPQE